MGNVTFSAAHFSTILQGHGSHAETCADVKAGQTDTKTRPDTWWRQHDHNSVVCCVLLPSEGWIIGDQKSQKIWLNKWMNSTSKGGWASASCKYGTDYIYKCSDWGGSESLKEWPPIDQYTERLIWLQGPEAAHMTLQGQWENVFLTDTWMAD